MKLKVKHISNSREAYRLEVPDGCSLAELKQSLVEQLAVLASAPAADVAVSLNKKDALSEDNSASLTSLGVCSGDLLWVLARALAPTAPQAAAAAAAAAANAGRDLLPSAEQQQVQGLSSLTNLLFEIQEAVLALLAAKDLAALCCSCTPLRHRASTDTLWKPLFDKDFPQHPNPSSSSSSHGVQGPLAHALNHTLNQLRQQAGRQGWKWAFGAAWVQRARVQEEARRRARGVLLPGHIQPYPNPMPWGPFRPTQPMMPPNIIGGDYDRFPSVGFGGRGGGGVGFGGGGGLGFGGGVMQLEGDGGVGLGSGGALFSAGGGGLGSGGLGFGGSRGPLPGRGGGGLGGGLGPGGIGAPGLGGGRRREGGGGNGFRLY
ncbi:hypothetical protein OEZ85_005655 [Tetradesmus obliquus]|uniref:F-box domain-containing protein n=1 Tax=Tetradesmus obliquus TaxID=3088 RepID=A0ABY8UEZ0_TETOB|nr:hypothetical protein OEZ85_005655 [Tetradesmus obliquus]